jgi:hypothetical protein
MEVVAVERWLGTLLPTGVTISTLKAPDNTVKVFNGAIPDQYDAPAILFACSLPGKPVTSQPARLSFVPFVFRIWGIVPGYDRLPLEPYIDDAHGLVNVKTGHSVSGNVIYCERIRPFAPMWTKDDAGQPWSRLGNDYRIFVQPLS